MSTKEKRKYLQVEKELEFIRRDKRIARISLEERKYDSNKDRIRARDQRATRIRHGSSLSIMPPIDQSPELSDIVTWFILPWFTKEHLPTLTLKEQLALFFNVTSRDVVMAAVVKAIPKMPGYIIDKDGTRRPPINEEAHFPRGTPLFVRIDDNMPDRIDIENAEKPDLVFHLTKDQYKTILDSIKEITGCNYKLDPPQETRKPVRK